MSSAAKYKSKDKLAGKDQKSSSKSSATVSVTSGNPASLHNPFLTSDASSAYSLPSFENGRTGNTDESDDHSGSTHGSGLKYDSSSNPDSRFVESDEHNKDKTSSSSIRQEAIPGADDEKREKIRQKNERKHQRQRERRAQELHERCSGYLMSRKLEALAQQLVSMGFSAERATMALIMNEGKVEEAVAWLFEVEEDPEKQHKDQNLGTGGHLKLDISEELSRIAEMEATLKCSKQEVERVVVSCEGDLDKADEILRSQKWDLPSSPLSKQEEINDLTTPSSNGKVSVAVNQNSLRPQPKSSQLVGIQQPRKDEKDFNYTGASVGSTSKMTSKIAHPLPRVQPKVEWACPQPQQVMGTTTATEKRWLAGGSTGLSVSHSTASSLQVSSPMTKTESRHTSVGNRVISECNNLNPGMVREPIVMMQRAHSTNDNNKTAASVMSISSSPPGTAVGWNPSTSDIMKKHNGIFPHIPASRSSSPNSFGSGQFFHQAHYQHQQNQFAPRPRSSPVDQLEICRNTTNALWSRAGPSPTLAVASSLGLFSGVGSACSNGSISQVDWHTGGSMKSCDYNNIDWSLDRTSMPSPGKPSNGFWLGMSSFSKSSSFGFNMDDPNAAFMGVRNGMRQRTLNSNGVSLAGLQDVGPSSGDGSSVGSQEWTSPFEEKDLFSLPRPFVSSPTL